MDLFEKCCKRVAKAIKADGQKTVYVEYSAYDDTDNLDEVAAHGKVVLISCADEFWGGEKSRAFRSPVLENPTWLQVSLQANRMIKQVRDHHHCFLEGLQETSTEIIDGEPVKILEFVMGS